MDAHDLGNPADTARYEEITSPCGHDAFLMEWEQAGRILRETRNEERGTDKAAREA
jgi:homoserine acetyltransferase